MLSSSNNDEQRQQGSLYPPAGAVEGEGDLVPSGNDEGTHRRKSKDEKKKKSKKKKKPSSSSSLEQQAVPTDGITDNTNGIHGSGPLPGSSPSKDAGRIPPEMNEEKTTRHEDDKQLLVIDEENPQPGRCPRRNDTGDDEEGGLFTRPGAVHVSRSRGGRVNVETVSTITDLTLGSSNEDLFADENDLPGSMEQTTTSSRDVLAEAELVNDATIVVSVAATPDVVTEEFQDRLEMLEKDKAKRERKEKKGSSSSFFMSSRAMILALFVLSLVLGVILYMVRENARKGNDNPPPTNMPSLSPTTQQPSSYPTDYPTDSPTLLPSSVPTVDVKELWIDLIQSQSTSTTFENETSPEYKALEWMVSDPFTTSIFNDPNRVLQRFALAVLWYATGATLGGGWLRDGPECIWGGTALRCDKDTVVGINMVRFSLSGTIPKELGLLSSLTHLGLDGNKFKGTIPTEIGKLSNLTHLILSYSKFEDATIPSEIGLLTNLKVFVSGETSLQGSIPTEIGMLSLCELFSIYNNNLTKSTLPSEVGLMTSLSILDISGNQALGGTFPSELAYLNKSLEQLILFDTNLSGTMPSTLCAPARSLSIDCEKTTIECECCNGPWPNFEPCRDPTQEVTTGISPPK